MTTVLLIEKNEPAVNLMEWVLRDDGFDVVVASDIGTADGASAVRPDVIVFNTHMLGDGKRLWVSTLRFLVPGVSVIDLASAGYESFDTGADAYMTQPYRMESLVNIITTLTGKVPSARSEVS